MHGNINVKSVTLLWLLGRPTAEGAIILLCLAYFLLFFILLVSFASLFCPYLHLFLPLDLCSCLFNCFFSPPLQLPTKGLQQ